MKDVQESQRVVQANRVIVGNCPECGTPLVMLNDHEAWGYFLCKCGWHGATGAVENYTRFDKMGRKVEQE